MNTSRRLIWFDESGSRPATRRAGGGPTTGWDARRASVPMRQAAPRRVTASSVASGRAAPGLRCRIDCYTDVAEIRTAAGPSSAVQCVFNGGPYTTASQVRQCQLVCPPPPCPRQATCPTRTWSRAKRVTGFPHDAATSGSGRRVS